MEWKDVSKIMNGTMPAGKHMKITGNPLQDYTKETLQCLLENFRNNSEVEAVLRVATVVIEAVKGTEIVVQMQPGHATFTDFYFIIVKDREDIPLAFIEVKNTSLAVRMATEVKPVAQALREAQIICNLGTNALIKVPFIYTD